MNGDRANLAEIGAELVEIEAESTEIGPEFEKESA
jgi:hypothetical protein